MSKKTKFMKDLYELFAAVESPKEAELLLDDLLTAAERESFAVRWQEIQALASGKTHRQIAKDLGISISKVTRGANQFKNSKGGFSLFLKKLKKDPHS